MGKRGACRNSVPSGPRRACTFLFDYTNASAVLSAAVLHISIIGTRLCWRQMARQRTKHDPAAPQVMQFGIDLFGQSSGTPERTAARASAFDVAQDQLVGASIGMYLDRKSSVTRRHYWVPVNRLSARFRPRYFDRIIKGPDKLAAKAVALRRASCSSQTLKYGLRASRTVFAQLTYRESLRNVEAVPARFLNDFMPERR